MISLKDDEKVALTFTLKTQAGNAVPFPPDSKPTWSTPNPEIVALSPSSSDPFVAEASAAGVVGVATITATDGVRTATADVTVTPGEPVAVEIVPGLPVKK